MSEKLVAFLFRLYPPAFRQRYLQEALLLCRDRRRQETGIYRKLRLACDLFIDFFAGLPKAWQTPYSIVTVKSPAPNTQPVPSFSLLHPEPLRPTSILLGCMFSITAFGVFVLILRTTALYPLESRVPSAIDSVMRRLNQPTLPPDQSRALQKGAGVPSASAGTQQPIKSDETAPTGFGLPSAPQPILRAQNDISKTLFASTVRNNGHLSLAFPGKFSINALAGAPGTSRPKAPAVPDQRKAAASQGQVKPQNATQAMIQAISAHQIVMFGETHGNKQEYEWLCRLVKTPAFADRVDDIVVEFGNSLYQKTVDRYIAGEDIPQAQIEKAWRNMIGAVGPISPVYGWFYQAVRESNLKRHDGHKIRLILGDPYGD